MRRTLLAAASMTTAAATTYYQYRKYRLPVAGTVRLHRMLRFIVLFLLSLGLWAIIIWAAAGLVDSMPS